jgi:poly(hydroxyalkanoate) granule-associated protein
MPEQPTAPPADSPAPRTRKWSDVVTSSRQVWLAGLGALADAQIDGGKALEALVKRGQEIERRIEREGGLTRRPRGNRSSPGAKVPAAAAEKVALLFENRVARALDRLGMRPAAEIDKLSAQLQKLSARVAALERKLAKPEQKQEKREPPA